MSALRVTLAVICLSCLPTSVSYAQSTTLAVPIETGQFAWDIPAGSTATQHVLTCGSITYVVPMPADRARIREVVPGPGTYQCALYAENAFGGSASVAFPLFQTGSVPLTPTGVRLEVR